MHMAGWQRYLKETSYQKYNTIQFLPHSHWHDLNHGIYLCNCQPRSPLPFPNFARHTMLEYEYQKYATEGEIAPRAFLCVAHQYSITGKKHVCSSSFIFNNAPTFYP